MQPPRQSAQHQSWSAARVFRPRSFYSEDPATRTNGGQMADPNTGSSYFEIDQLKPQDYEAIRNSQVGKCPSR